MQEVNWHLYNSEEEGYNYEEYKDQDLHIRRLTNYDSTFVFKVGSFKINDVTFTRTAGPYVQSKGTGLSCPLDTVIQYTIKQDPTKILYIKADKTYVISVLDIYDTYARIQVPTSTFIFEP